MGVLNTIALVIGWAVLAGAAAVAVSAVWWLLGEAVWRALPERWRKAQFWPVPQQRWGDFTPPGVSPWGLAAMTILGGPRGWVRLPGVLRANRRKRQRVREAAANTKGEGGGGPMAEGSGLFVSAEDCKRLAAMLDVHVRPVYYRAANRRGAYHEAERKLGAKMLAECDRLADAFTAAAQPQQEGEAG